MIHRYFKPVLCAAALAAALLGGVARAQDKATGDNITVAIAPCGLKVEDAWVRATVPGQKGTAAFMRLTAGQACQLVAVQSPIAGVAQLHRMTMDGGVMHMRAVKDGLPLAAGQTVELTPSGLHIMLMDLKQPVAEGASVPVTLTLQDQASGARGQVTVQATARSPAAVGAARQRVPMSHDMKGMDGMNGMSN